MSLFITVLTTLVLGITYASIFEWTLHRYVMHMRVRIWKWEFSYPFEAHTVTHHGLFKADYRYHLQVDADKTKVAADKKKIRMAWWNGPILVILCSLPFVFSATPFAILNWKAHGFAICVTGVTLAIAYFVAYEYLHWCMHLPRNRRLEMSWIFQRLNGHHLLHHRHMGKNLNVVCPIADFLFGTLITRAKVPFAQPRGPSVPDVQPLTA